RLFGINTIGLKRNGFSPERIREITNAYKILFKQGLLLRDALQTLDNEFSDSVDIKRLITFITSSDRGIAR
ncbi:MAG: acyl-[acyl-carrier-protein]--UDP-N-acetylglucosamine O-acyltransferase, partial [Deltaproteobacteria bacterium]|nr:acyl-[acyl-carrier-protein]--UDP-N-acetylglucosamine O-acyltransferase [Deltaproteobacteria bacterium]